MRRTTIPGLLLLFASATLVADDAPAELPLWPDGAPGALGEEPNDIPTIRIYPAEDANGCGVVVCPGGGYGGLAYDHEGHQVAKWYQRLGVTAAVLRYRHSPKYRHPIPLGDVQRAIRHLRANAKPLGIDPERIGVTGFSAGGHLASTVATHFDAGDEDAADPVDRVSCRPDFCVLAYPVISMSEPFTHRGSVRNLLGNEPSDELKVLLSNDQQVTKETPPTFLFSTADDPVVPVENSLAFFAACRRNGVEAELHVYKHGPHGVGLAPRNPVLGTWPDRLADWLRDSGFLTKGERAKVSGTITIDGQPLAWGQLVLLPEDDVRPTAMSMVSRGKYAIDEAHGPVPGGHRVSLVNLGGFVPRPTIDDAYELDTESIRVEVAPGENVVDLDLRTDR